MFRERRASLVIAAAAAALGGCFADAPADDVADDPRPDFGRAHDSIVDVLGGDPPPAVVHGTYRVPVPDDLAPFASYEVDEAVVEIVDNTLTVSFLLPEGLLGYTRLVTFTGAVAPGTEPGTAIVVSGGGECVYQVNGQVECELANYGVQVDRAAVTAYWTARGDAFVDARVQVASLFGEDPLGVLRLSVE